MTSLKSVVSINYCYLMPSTASSLLLVLNLKLLFFSSQKVVRFWPHWLHLPLNRPPRQVSSSPLASPLPVHSLFCSCPIFHHKFGICSTFKSFYMGIITNKPGDCLLAYHWFSHKQWNLSYLNPLGPRVVHMFESWGWRDFFLTLAPFLLHLISQ